MTKDLNKDKGKEVFTGGSPFGVGVANAVLQDLDLIDQLSAYKKRVASNYRAVLPEDIGTLPSNGLMVSTKIDGELWFLLTHSGKVFFANPRGRVIAGDLPIFKAVGKLPENTIIAGELHVKVSDGGGRCRVGDLAALIAQGAKADLAKLCFGAFDLVKYTQSDAQAVYADRLSILKKLLGDTENLFAIDSQEIDRKKLSEKFESEVASGKSEGLIARLSTGLIYKLKPAITIDAAVIAYTPNGDMARSLLLGLMMPDDKLQIFGGCGNLGSDDDRKDLLKKLTPLNTSSNLRYASDGGSLYTFVKPELVVEVRVSDLQAEHSDGNASKAMRLEFVDGQWKNLGMASCPRPIHPVLVGVREDKAVNSTDIRFDQISGYAVIEAEKPTSKDLPKSAVIRREVWTKETKGVTAVRKLVVWKTNKHEVESGFPSYVVHWTDYSPGRASPLDREVKLAPNEKAALMLADAMVEENIKKGWEKHSGA